MLRAATQARETALRYVYRCDARDELFCDEDDYHHFMIHFRQRANDAFCEKLCLGTLKNVEEIDKLIEAYAANWKLPRMARIDHALLRVGTYELTALATPFKVVINEAVELAGRYGGASSKAFVNGVLHGIAHEVANRNGTENG